jgi:hypothetical protein
MEAYVTRFCSLLILLFLASTAFAQVPRKISFQGVLTDTLGNPRPDGTYSLTFRMHDASTGNSPLWTEARSVSLKRGLLSVLLGDVTPIPDVMKFDRPYWLGIQLGSSAELSPRTELAAVGYSFRSVRADTAQFAKDIAPGTAVRVVNGITDEVTLVPGSNISINQIGNTLRISAGGGGGSLRFPLADTAASDDAVLSLTNTGYGGAISGESKQGGIGVSGQSNYVAVSGYSTGATGVQGGGPTRGVYGLSDLGTGVEGGHTLQSGISPAVYGWSASKEDEAIGILGELNSVSSGFGSVAVKGVNKGGVSTGVGVWGEQAGSGYGVYGKTTSGTGVYGVTSGSNQSGVFGMANATSGLSYGVRGENWSKDGTGVYGYANAIGGNTVGVYGRSDWTGDGVQGFAAASTGNTSGVRGVSESETGRGVDGYAGSSTGVNYGVYGETHSGSGYAVFAVGRVGATIKSFRIDHPQEPSGKYLLHYCAEGPEPENVYNGNVVTDANGTAIITLPSYFGEINKDPRYTLTVINEGGTDFVQAMVVQKIQNNRFVIRSSKPAIEVSWEVKAVRNDLWVRTYGAPVQVEKQGLERGKYQHPELYGLPEEMGINYRPERTRPTTGPEPVGITPPENKMEKGGRR